jgi:hypothetical protein
MYIAHPDTWKENISCAPDLPKIKVGRGISTAQCTYQEALKELMQVPEAWLFRKWLPMLNQHH